jgi:hypothetical protein
MMICLYQDSESLPEMLNTGAEIVGSRKSVLDHLGKARNFLRTLLDLGTVTSEVRI